MVKRNTPEAFWASLIKKEDGCWEHPNKPKNNGYIDVKYDHKTWRSHRLALHLSGVQLVDDLVVDHLCRNRQCCNPSHLEQVDFRTNTIRGQSPLVMRMFRTHCDHGHEFTPENSLIRGRHRRCKTCDRKTHAKMRLRKRAIKNAVLGLWPLEDAANAVGLTPNDLIAEAQAWAVANTPTEEPPTE